MAQGEEVAQFFRETFSKVQQQIGKAVVGQEETVQAALIGLAAGGHILLEGAPGLGKTLLVRSLSQAVDLTFSRIQFTPDLMPADITGTNILAEEQSGERRFVFRRGPIFAHILLADEINRATPKTQSALLEAMQESAVTVAGERHQLSPPFLVMATQNPIEMEGTYVLPEAQLDRFLLKVLVPYPTKEELNRIVNQTTSTHSPQIEKAADSEMILQAQRIVREVELAPSVLDFGLSLIEATHPNSKESPEIARRYVRYGSSPRGAQSVIIAAKVLALMAGRYNVSKDDIRRAALPALRHRVLLNYEAEADGIAPDAVVEAIIAHADAKDREPVRV